MATADSLLAARFTLEQMGSGEWSGTVTVISINMADPDLAAFIGEENILSKMQAEQDDPAIEGPQDVYGIEVVVPVELTRASAANEAITSGCRTMACGCRSYSSSSSTSNGLRYRARCRFLRRLLVWDEEAKRNYDKEYLVRVIHVRLSRLM